MEQMQALLAKEELSLALFEAWNTKEVGEEMLCEVGKKIREKYGNYDAAQADASLWADFKEKYVKSGKKWASNIKARLLLRWAFPGHKAVDDGRYYKLVDGKPVFDKERTDKGKKDKKAKAEAEAEAEEEDSTPVVAAVPSKAAGGGGAQAAPKAAGGGGAAPEAGVDALAGALKSMAIGGSGAAAAAAVEGPACSLCKKLTTSVKDCTLCKQSVGDCCGSIMTRGRYTRRFVCHSTCQDSAAWAVEEPTTDIHEHRFITALVRQGFFYSAGSYKIYFGHPSDNVELDKYMWAPSTYGERHPVHYVVKATKGDTITFQKIVRLPEDKQLTCGVCTLPVLPEDYFYGPWTENGLEPKDHDGVGLLTCHVCTKVFGACCGEEVDVEDDEKNTWEQECHGCKAAAAKAAQGAAAGGGAKPASA